MSSDIEQIKGILRDMIGSKAKMNESSMRKEMMNTVGKDLVAALTPLLKEMAASNRSVLQDFKQAIREIKIEAPEVEIPEICMPNITLPPFPKIPTPLMNYTPPAIHMPEIKMPEEMNVKGWINLMGYDRGMLQNPLPVQLRDAKGNPLNLFENLRQIIQGGAVAPGAPQASRGWSGGKADFFTIVGIQNTVAVVSVDSSGVGYSGSNPLPVTITSGGNATSGSAIVDSSGVQYSGSNPLPVVFGAGTTSAVALIDSTGVEYEGANPIPTYQATAPTFTSSAALIDSSGAQYSGSNPLPVTIASGSNNTVGAALIDSTGAEYEGANPLPVYIATAPTFTQAVSLVDSTGAEYEGSNPIPVTLISGALTSTISVGPSASGVADDGSAPIQQGGIARTANPGAVSNGQVVKASYDKLGRQVMRTHQVRDLIQTAYVQITGGTETTLRAGVAGAYLDLIMIVAANNSDAAVSVDIRQVTGGSVVNTLQVPANGTVGFAPPIPYPQQDTGNNWTVDGPDISGTTVSFTGLFSQEI